MALLVSHAKSGSTVDRCRLAATTVRRVNGGMILSWPNRPREPHEHEGVFLAISDRLADAAGDFNNFAKPSLDRFGEPREQLLRPAEQAQAKSACSARRPATALPRPCRAPCGCRRDGPLRCRSGSHRSPRPRLAAIAIAQIRQIAVGSGFAGASSRVTSVSMSSASRLRVAKATARLLHVKIARGIPR